MSPRYSGQSDLLRPGAEAEATAIFSPRIFLVDPDPLTRALLVDYLRGKGFDVVAAAQLLEDRAALDGERQAALREARLELALVERRRGSGAGNRSAARHVVENLSH